MSPAAQAAADAFYATLREKGCRVNQAQLELAWERAAKAALVVGAMVGAVEAVFDDVQWKGAV